MEMMLIYLAASVLVAVLLYAVVIYNALVRLKNNVAKAWANITVLLKQRSDEIPKLVDVCKGYMQHERQALEAVVKARQAVNHYSDKQDIDHLGQAETLLRHQVHQLFARAEAYPELKANQQFYHLQQRISGLENQIADRREFFNDSVNLYNTRIEEFPDLLIARLANYRHKDLLVFTDDQVVPMWSTQQGLQPDAVIN